MTADSVNLVYYHFRMTKRCSLVLVDYEYT